MPRDELAGNALDAATVWRRSTARHVNASTPPGFLDHAIGDSAVPVQHSPLTLNAMRAAGRPIEAHLGERGGYGFGAGQPD